MGTDLKNPQHGRIIRDIVRPSKELIALFSTFYTGIVLDHMGKLGGMNMDIKPIATGMKLCGPAVTALGPDLSVRRMAIDLAQPGDVLVVAAGGIREYACFGDGTALRMQIKGIAGAVIDGSTRDAEGIRTLGFSTFARGVTARNYHYPVSGEYGAVNVPVYCGNVQIVPGDIVIGDDDGIVVVPQDLARTLAPLIEQNLAEERIMRSSWQTYEPYNLQDELEGRGYRVVE